MKPDRARTPAKAKKPGKVKDPKPTAASKGESDAPVREGPSAYKLIAVVALIVALDILLFFAIGYFVGTQIL